ncbi:hypothetical protein [Psychrobacter sp. KH172YL61]|uniref:hypothetical protein n=1 Tax=Psychrobacter sp. KH172YL61 TaxID=2517899 RepID=UPI001F07260A|nr:hypothetical protein [Psychrobacter sp. KH172YL61]
MTTKQPLFQRLPLLLATGVLGTGLLLSGCSNNESAVTETATNNEEVAAVVDTSDTDTAEQKTQQIAQVKRLRSQMILRIQRPLIMTISIQSLLRLTKKA